MKSFAGRKAGFGVPPEALGSGPQGVKASAMYVMAV